MSNLKQEQGNDKEHTAMIHVLGPTKGVGSEAWVLAPTKGVGSEAWVLAPTKGVGSEAWVRWLRALLF